VRGTERGKALHQVAAADHHAGMPAVAHDVERLSRIARRRSRNIVWSGSTAHQQCCEQRCSGASIASWRVTRLMAGSRTWQKRSAPPGAHRFHLNDSTPHNSGQRVPHADAPVASASGTLDSGRARRQWTYVLIRRHGQWVDFDPPGEPIALPARSRLSPVRAYESRRGDAGSDGSGLGHRHDERSAPSAVRRPGETLHVRRPDPRSELQGRVSGLPAGHAPRRIQWLTRGVAPAVFVRG